MKVVGFCGYSGAGKTTLIEALIPRFKAAGHRVSVIKHAHHGFDMDQPGKDSWRHREAGAFEVLIASDRRLVLLREAEQAAEPDLNALIAELSACDWVFVEGFRRSDLPKVEVWRPAAGKPVIYPDDPHVVAVCTDGSLPIATTLPVLDLNQADAIGRFLLGEAQRYDYPIRRAVGATEPDVAGRRADPPAGRGHALVGD